MTGILCALVGMGGSNSLNATMTVGSQVVSMKANQYYAGYIDTASQASVLASTPMGALVPDIYKGATVVSLYWTSSISFGSTSGTLYIEVSGNRPTGFIGQLSVNGTVIATGTGLSGSYNSSFDTTLYTLNSSTSNPFGTSGTKTIAVTP